MKIEIAYPPNISKIKERFTVPAYAVFTYGDTIYNPINGYVDAYLMTHEATHSKQQGDDIEGWWDKYLKSSLFRFEQEVEAYHNQYNHFCRNKKDSYKQSEFLKRLAGDLSSPMYGNVCTLEEAMKVITTGKI